MPTNKTQEPETLRRARALAALRAIEANGGKIQDRLAQEEVFPGGPMPIQGAVRPFGEELNAQTLPALPPPIEVQEAPQVGAPSITPYGFDDAMQDPEAYYTEEEATNPALDTSKTSFFDKPGTTDALTAFGAAMLKAPDFLTGLGDAALAVNKVEREYRMPTEQEIARANMRQRVSDITNGSVEARYQEAIEMGLDEEEARQYAFNKKYTPPKQAGANLSAGDKKAIQEGELEVAELENTQSVLDRALELNDKTFTGVTAEERGRIGTSGIPGSNLIIDREAAEATREWSNIMGQEAIKVMADSLKGATTNFELQEFVRKLADPTTPPAIRRRIIEKMKKLARVKAEIIKERNEELRAGTYYQPGGGQSGNNQPSAGTEYNWTKENGLQKAK